MLNFISYRRSNRRQDILSMDFVTLCFLDPSENANYVGFRSTGIMDKMIHLTKSLIPKMNKTDADMAYYKAETESFF
ncbi:MAG: hypothetical protein M0Z56_10230 [Desulfobacteraceae bacterium]|nr:hypothetical protein [Desulfobacteraceae bacterium]